MVYGAVFVVRVVLVWCFLRSKNRDFCVWKQTWKARLMLNFVMSTPLIPTISSPVCVQAQYRGLVNRVRHLGPLNKIFANFGSTTR